MYINIDYGKVGAAIGGCGVIFSIYLACKLRKISNTVDVAVDKVTNDTHVEIEDAIVHAAIQKAVNKEVEYIASNASRRLSEEIRQQVKDTIRAAYKDVKESVSYELTNQVKKINTDELERDVIEKAKEAIAEKFDKRLDGIVDEFNNNLNSVSKIYRTIANKMEVQA